MDEQVGIGAFHSTPGDTERITEILREDHGTEYQVVEGPASRKCELDDNVFRDFRCGDFGNAILVRKEGDVGGVVEGSEENRELPFDGDEGRTLTEAEIRVDGSAVDVFTTHISSRGEPEEPNVIDPQVPQIGAVMDAVEDTRGPAILAGDFNVTLGSDRPSAEEINRFDELGLTDAAADAGATSTCGEGRRIDYVFTRDLVRWPRTTSTAAPPTTTRSWSTCACGTESAGAAVWLADTGSSLLQWPRPGAVAQLEERRAGSA
jgi:endonuclease/exonuclease/phosphatase family metal-dependent hydrolase